MNYLHHRNPPILHRDLKSSNLLVDRNWNVKVTLLFNRNHICVTVLFWQYSGMLSVCLVSGWRFWSLEMEERHSFSNQIWKRNCNILVFLNYAFQFCVYNIYCPQTSFPWMQPQWMAPEVLRNEPSNEK